MIIGTVDLLVCHLLLVLKVVYNVLCLALAVDLNKHAVVIVVGLLKSKITSLSMNSLLLFKDQVFYLNANPLVIGYKCVHAVFAVLTHVFTLNYFVQISLLLLKPIA